MADEFAMNSGAVRDELVKALEAELSRYIDGTVDQLNGPIQQMANHMLVAARRGRMDLVDECRDQLIVAMEERKLAAREGMASVLDLVLTRGINLLFSGLVAGLAGLKPGS